MLGDWWSFSVNWISSHDTGGSDLLLCLTVQIERYKKVPSVFIALSGIFPPDSFFILCFWLNLQQIQNTDTMVEFLPRRQQRWKYNAAAWRNVAAECPEHKTVLTLCVTVWKGCANIMQMDLEDITVLDGISHPLYPQWSVWRGRKMLLLRANLFAIETGNINIFYWWRK